MLFLPFLVGITLRTQENRADWVALPLLALWLLGYFAFHALSLWLKSGQARYLRPIQVYGTFCALLGVLVLWQKPGLLGWGMVYAPLLGLGLWQAARKNDTSVLARWVSVLAACLICAVTYGDSFAPFIQQLSLPAQDAAYRDAGYGRTFHAVAVLSGYFLGTVLYVKTMIREKGEAAYVAASVSFHAALTLLSLWNAAHSGGAKSWGVTVFFALTTGRAALMPWLSTQRGKKITPKQVGLLEFGLSFGLLLLLTVPRH